ncbi:MAG: tetratricopeptide repeat protein [Terriglobia bacterium]
MRWKVVGTVILLMLPLGVATAREQIGETEEAGQLSQQATQLYQQGHYPEAAHLWERALTINEKVLGAEHPNTLATLNNRANVFLRLGEVEFMFQSVKT